MPFTQEMRVQTWRAISSRPYCHLQPDVSSAGRRGVVGGGGDSIRAREDIQDIAAQVEIESKT